VKAERATGDRREREANVVRDSPIGDPGLCRPHGISDEHGHHQRARTDHHQQDCRSPVASAIRTIANHRITAESDTDRAGVAHADDQPTDHDIADAGHNGDPDQP
jgi:hypothetical protein